jgi:hypothetical protein
VCATRTTTETALRASPSQLSLARSTPPAPTSAGRHSPERPETVAPSHCRRRRSSSSASPRQPQPPLSQKAKRHRRIDPLVPLILPACQRHERCTTTSCTPAKTGGPLLPLPVTVAAIKLAAFARRRTGRHPTDPSEGAPDPPQEAVDPTDGVSKEPLGPSGKSAATSRMARPPPDRDALPQCRGLSCWCRASGPQLGRRRGRGGRREDVWRRRGEGTPELPAGATQGRSSRGAYWPSTSSPRPI